MAHKVTVTLNDEEWEFMKAMAKRDGDRGVKSEMQSLACCEIWHWMELHAEELRQEGYLK